MTEGIANVDESENADVSEIEVTPEMIKAGVDELYGHPIMEPNDEVLAEAVKAVYCRMLEARRRSSRVV